MGKQIIKIGIVGVDSGQLVITDPCSIQSQFINPDSGSYDDHAHTIYRHREDKSLWQYTYGKKPQGGVNPFPGTYETIIPQYGMSPNELKKQNIFEKTDIDPTPHIPEGEFSFRGICKANKNGGGQLNYTVGLRQPGVAVVVSSGLGDGEYDVMAEIVDGQVKKVWIQFF